MAGKKPKSAAKKSKPEPSAEAPAFRHVARKKRSSGKGATPAEIGASLVALFNSGKADEVPGLWHHKKIESIESDGTVFEGPQGRRREGRVVVREFHRPHRAGRGALRRRDRFRGAVRDGDLADGQPRRADERP